MMASMASQVLAVDGMDGVREERMRLQSLARVGWTTTMTTSEGQEPRTSLKAGESQGGVLTDSRFPKAGVHPASVGWTPLKTGGEQTLGQVLSETGEQQAGCVPRWCPRPTALRGDSGREEICWQTYG